MTMDNFVRKIDEDSRMIYIEFIEDPTKTRQSRLHPKHCITNPKIFATEGENCPVALFDLYVSKRPTNLRNCGRFYLATRQHMKTNDAQ